jgi:hypothetical protein
LLPTASLKVMQMSLATIPAERRAAEAERGRRGPAGEAIETRPVIVGAELAGLLIAREQGWRFRSLRPRFDPLDGGCYCRAEDAVCAARGIVALGAPALCRCAYRSDRARCELLRELEAVLEREAA